MNKALTSVFVVLVLFSLKCSSWPRVGDQAKSDYQCEQQYGKDTCQNRWNTYTCAKIDGDDNYIINETVCDFCRTYGNSEAIVYYIGRERSCKELEVGVYMRQDPECYMLYVRSSIIKNINHCLPVHNLTKYYCAEHEIGNGIFYQADTKCEICVKYGNAGNIKITSIGDPSCNKTEESAD